MNGARRKFAPEALGRALSKQGSFRFAKRIVLNLSLSGNKKVPPVTGNPHIKTEINVLK
jgi:hypothetical protein